MIRSLVLTFILTGAIWSLPSQGQEPQETLHRFSTARDELDKAQVAFEFCKTALSEQRLDLYQNQLKNMASLWTVNPEAVQTLLTTCQDMWVTRYLNPTRLAAIKSRNRSIVHATIIPAIDLLAQNLPAQIRAYLNLIPPDQNLRPSPFELVSHLAADQREFEEILYQETRKSIAQVTEVSGLTMGSLVLMRNFANVTASTSKALGRYFKQGLALSLVALGSSLTLEYGLQSARESDLTHHVAVIQSRLLKSRNPAETFALLDAYYRALLRLGFFYNLDLYQAESGKPQPPSAGSLRCVNEMRAFLDSGAKLASCPSPAVQWALAHQFLSGQLPQTPDVQLVAENLMAKAKRAFWFQLEAQAYLKSLPKCEEKIDSVLFKTSLECTDSQSGGPVL